MNPVVSAGAEIAEVAGDMATQFNKKVAASRSRNKELGEAGSLMQYLIGLIGWLTRTSNCEYAFPWFG
jgi:hypothetical protein